MSVYIDYDTLSMLVFRSDCVEVLFAKIEILRTIKLADVSRDDLAKRFGAARRVVRVRDSFFAVDDIAFVYREDINLHFIFTNKCFFHLGEMSPEECVGVVAAVEMAKKRIL